MTFVVAITGGMGCGKSAVAQFFSDLGVPVIDADQIARDLVAKGQRALADIIKHFGPKILKSDGELNRGLLREIIFNHPEEKKWLEGLLHPLIYQTLADKISEINYTYCITVIPLLTEQYALYQKLIDYVVLIDASEEQQLAWVTKRDSCSNALIKKMIYSQATPQERLKIADTVLLNNSTLEELKKKVLNLHHKISTQLS